MEIEDYILNVDVTDSTLEETDITEEEFQKWNNGLSGFAINLIGSFKVYILFAISELFIVQASKNSRLITASLISAKNWVLASSDGSWPRLFNTWL